MMTRGWERERERAMKICYGKKRCDRGGAGGGEGNYENAFHTYTVCLVRLYYSEYMLNAGFSTACLYTGFRFTSRQDGTNWYSELLLSPPFLALLLLRTRCTARVSFDIPG